MTVQPSDSDFDEEQTQKPASGSNSGVQSSSSQKENNGEAGPSGSRRLGGSGESRGPRRGRRSGGSGGSRRARKASHQRKSEKPGEHSADSGSSGRASLREAYEQVFKPELPPDATRTQRWEAAVDGPLLIVSVIFLGLFTWSSLGESGSSSTRIADFGMWIAWLLFSIDYVVRLILAEERWKWFWHHWWELLLVILPWFRPLQVLRVVPVLVLMQRFSASNKRVNVAMYTGAATVLLVLVAALSIYDAEYGNPDSQITSFADALWWSIVTITTVGYGDIAPVTAFGRVIGIFLMVGGIAVAGIVTATVAAWLVEQVDDDDEEDESAGSTDSTDGSDEDNGGEDGEPAPRYSLHAAIENAAETMGSAAVASEVIPEAREGRGGREGRGSTSSTARDQQSPHPAGGTPDADELVTVAELTKEVHALRNEIAELKKMIAHD